MKEKILHILASALKDTEFFVVEVINSSDNRRIEVYLDGDEGINIDECTKIHRMLTGKIEEEDLSSLPYDLFVSSPGLDRPLKLSRQYRKNVGRKLLISSKNEQFKGELIYADDEKIIVKGGKKGMNSKTFLLKEIDKALVTI